jgi:hypothetical protein
MHVSTDFGSRRGEAMERKRMVSELLLPKPGGMCYRHNLARLEGGPRARWAQRIIEVGLRIGPYAGVLRLGLAMYLDRRVCLN